MNNVTIQSSCGHTLLPGQTATLTAVIDNAESYKFLWQKKNLNNELFDWSANTQSITISSEELSEDIIYVVNVIENNIVLTDANDNILTDSSNNILTASITMYSSEKGIYHAQENDEIIPYVQELSILLTTRGKHIYGKINNIDTESINYKINDNAADELSFTVHKSVDNITEKFWDKIIDFRLVYVKELNEYFQIKVDTNEDGNDITKSVSATSLCEAELSQKYIYNTEINTEDDIARDDYVVTKFYSLTDKKASLLDRILSFAPHYKIGHVDDTLIELQRSFSIDNVSIYDFLTGDCAKQFNCIFKFDSMTRTINVYDLYTNCLNPECGYRGEFNDVCPECGSTKLSYYGEDTSIYVDSKNLSDSITFSTDTDSVKNCFKITGGDDDITAAVRNVNPNGTDTIYYINDELKEEMSSELVSKLNSYDKLSDSKKQEYITLNNNIYEALDKILYYKSSMMPTVEKAEVTATTEAAKLTSENLNPLGLTKVNQSTSLSTVNSALKTYAKVFVKSGYVKVEVDEEKNSFTYVGTDEQHNHYGTWYGRFKITNYSDEDDVAYSDYMELKVYDLYSEFMEQKIKKNIASQDKNGEDSIFNVLTIKELSKFKEAIKLYSLARLTSFRDAIQTCLDILIEADQAKEQADMYKETYLPYYNKLSACEDEMNARQATIDEWQNKYDSYIKQRNDIQELLNFKNYLGEDLYNEFQSFIREDVYSNENYISDGLENTDILKKAEELLETAQKELYKSAIRQHTITANLYNLLQMKEFAVIRDKFQTGNWIRVRVDNKVYRLRLSSYEVNYGGLENINVEFTDITITTNGRIDTQSIVNKAQQMATSYSYVSTQAKRGEEARNSIAALLNSGFNASVTAIKNADTEDVIIGRDGITARAYDDIYGWYDPKQVKIIHNMIVFTDDRWRTASTAIGEINYTLDGVDYSTYGVISKALISGIIISGNIYSANYSSTNKTGTHIDLETGSFSLAGDKIVYTAGGNKITLKDVVVEYVTDEGKHETTDIDKVITGQKTTTLYVDQVVTKYMSTDSFYARFAEIDIAKIKELYVNSAFITSLAAEYVTINTLKTKYLDADTIKTTYLDAESIKSTYLATKDFSANFAAIDIAKIKQLYADSAFIKTLQTEMSSSISSTVDTEFVKNLIVGHATLNDLFTSNFTVGSDEGGSVVMNGSTMQFKDKNGNVYVQIGTDKSGGHSIIINDAKGTTIMDGSGITANAIADGLIIDKMVKKKDTNYNGISGDKLNIDSVVTAINNGSTTIKSSLIYFDEDKQTLNTKLSVMQDKFSEEIENKIAEAGVYQAWIESENGNVLYSSTSTILTAVLKQGNTIIDTDGKTHRYVWRRKSTDGKMDAWYSEGKTITVKPSDFSDNMTYYCEISNTSESDTLVDASGNILLDASNNILTYPFPIITCEITLYKNINEQLKTNYYSKAETPSAVTTIIAQTDLEKVNGGFKSLTDTMNKTVDTVDSHSQTISQTTTKVSNLEEGQADLQKGQEDLQKGQEDLSGKYTTVETKQSDLEQDLDGFKKTVSKTYMTSNDVDTKIAESGVFQAWVESDRTDLSDNTTATLKVHLKKGNTEIADSDTSYVYTWKKVSVSGITSTWTATGKSLSVNMTSETEDMIFTCTISNNSKDIISCEIALRKNVKEYLKSTYYTKSETDSQITKFLKETDLTTTNGSIKSLNDKYNKTVETVDGISSTIGSHTESISSITSNINNINGNISAINGNIDTVNDSIGDINKNISGINDNIGGINENITNITNKQNTYERTIDGFKKELTESFIKDNDVDAHLASNTNYTAYVRSVKPDVTDPKKSTLTAIILTNQDNTELDTEGKTYTYTWHREYHSGYSGSGDTWSTTGKTISVTTEGFDYTPTYVCEIKNGNTVLITCKATLRLNTQTILAEKYYTKTETVDKISETLKSTAWINENTELQKLKEQANETKKTADSNKTTITETISALNGNNLLRNSDNLDFEDYILGSMLINANGDILVDASGNILVA